MDVKSYIKSWVCVTCEFIINEEETYLITIQDMIMPSIMSKRSLRAATEEGIVVIKKTIKIKINDQVLTIGPKFTIPTNKNKLRTMSVTHRGDHIIIETSNSQVMIFLLKANQVKILLCNSKRKLVPYNILMTSMIMTYL